MVAKCLHVDRLLSLVVLLWAFMLLLTSGCSVEQAEQMLAGTPSAQSVAAGSAMPMSPGQAASAGGTTVPHRLIYLLVDRSPRNRWRQEANRRIDTGILGRCGPGDTVVLIYLRPEFIPEDCVRFIYEFPPDLPAYHATPTNQEQFYAVAQSLATVWGQIDADRARLSAYLAEPVPAEEDQYASVDFAGGLKYAADSLVTSSGFDEKHLIFFGPLPTSVPDPQLALRLADVHVKALYCDRPSGVDWAAMTAAWASFLAEDCGAAPDFIILDRAQSLGRSDEALFAANLTPRCPSMPGR